MGRFQPNFRRPLEAKLWMGAKKVFGAKMMAPCKISWKLRDALRRERTKCDVFFVYNRPENTVTGDLVALLQQEIALRWYF